MLPILLMALFVSQSLAKPKGAPTAACADLTPRHGVPPQTSPMPYTVTISDPIVTRDSRVTITIKGGTNLTFKGFMVQGRSSGVNALGTFSTGWNAQAINCPGGTNNTATHVNNIPKNEVVLLWAPPHDFTGPVTFFVTIVQEKVKFWVAHKIGSVTVL